MFSPIRKRILCDLYRVYVTAHPDKVPKNAQVKTTTRGAKYYETDEIQRTNPNKPLDQFATVAKPETVDVNTIFQPHMEQYTSITSQLQVHVDKRKEMYTRANVLSDQLTELKKIKGNVKDRNKVRKEIEEILRYIDWKVDPEINKYETQMMEAMQPIYQALAGYINKGKENQPSYIMDTTTIPPDTSEIRKYHPDVPLQSFHNNLAAQHLYEHIEPAKEWFAEITKGIPSTGPTYIYPLAGNRSFKSEMGDNNNFICLSFSWTAKYSAFRRAFVHEMAHILEKSGNIQNRCNEFFAKRTGDSPVVPLKEATGKNYNDTEICKPDNFPNPYCGKLYKDRPGEILSMGIQYLYQDPIHFYQKDPDYFNFIVNVLKEAKQ